VNNDIAVCSKVSHNIQVVFRKNGQSAWTNQINVSNQTGTTAGPYSQFDEQGDLHVVYNQERSDGSNDLVVKVALIKRDPSGNYSLVDNQWATAIQSGDHLLPSLAVVGGKGLITFMWKQQAGYYYLPYERSGDALVFDGTTVARIATAPVSPVNMYCSRAIAHVDEIMFTYFDTQHTLKLRRWKSGQWVDSQPIALESAPINKWPYNVYTDPNIGLIAVWFVEEEQKGITYYCIFNYPKSSVHSPVSVTYTKGYERNLFHGFYVYNVTWANNPYNIENNITVVKFNIYRRPQGSAGSWVNVGSVDGTVFAFADADGITVDSDFIYAVTAVNDKNIESGILDVESGPALSAEKIVRDKVF
jgi:hypothetical protein